MNAEQAEFHVAERERVDPTELVTEPHVAMRIDVVLELVSSREHRTERCNPRCQLVSGGGWTFVEPAAGAARSLA